MNPHTSSTFDSVHAKYQPVALQVAIYMLRNRAEADDAVQAAFIDLWHRTQISEPIGNPRAWLIQAVKNNCIDILRARKDDTSVDTMIEEGIEPAHEETIPTITPALRNALRTAVDQLSPQVSEVMSRHYFGGQLISQIAEEMKLSPGTVKGYLSSGRNSLRALFTRSAEEEAA
jgi:RNA polymerase sigma-70 factor (ECF subfamily)